MLFRLQKLSDSHNISYSQIYNFCCFAEHYSQCLISVKPQWIISEYVRMHFLHIKKIQTISAPSVENDF